jgi:hypothetical protein
MGLKKRSLSLVGRGLPSNHRYKRSQLVVGGTERYTKKGLGFFGHVTWQVSGSHVKRVEHLFSTTLKK